jgi:hypothetical protein
MKNYFKTYIPALYLILCIIACTSEDNPITDAQQIAALRNVKVVYDSMTFEIGLPSGALSGQSFFELLQNDSSTYADSENYSILIALNMTADNTDSDAEDAKFDGMELNIVMDTIESNPVNMSTEGFQVNKNETYPVATETTINLKTHRAAGLYIFRQTVDGNDLATTIYPYLNYEIGIQQGTLNLPSIYQEIPTRASDETKEFLRQLLESGIFDE